MNEERVVMLRVSAVLPNFVISKLLIAVNPKKNWRQGKLGVQWNSDIKLPGYNAFPPSTLFFLGPLGKPHKSNVCFSRIKRSPDIMLSRL